MIAAGGPRYSIELLEQKILALLKDTPAHPYNKGIETAVSAGISSYGLAVSKRFYNNKVVGSLSTVQADQWACFLHCHPSEIWPTWFEDADLEPACVVCGGLLKFGVQTDVCSDKCYNVKRRHGFVKGPGTVGEVLDLMASEDADEVVA